VGAGDAAEGVGAGWVAANPGRLAGADIKAVITGVEDAGVSSSRTA
jgi:hypothetical protein